MEPLSADDPRTVGEFALRARLGAGGMGQVYLGFSPAGRAVAIKVVHQALLSDREFRERFGREVAAARSVSGMYTAPVVATGLEDNPPWFATAFVPGPSLAEVVTKHGPLPEAAVWRLAAGLTEALRAVHSSGLVHRDLKPANVLLAGDGPHVIDFGISRAAEGTSLTQTGMVVGTPGYMSPEQAEGQQAGPQSDVFSLGCVLAFAAAGTPPFGGGSAASVLYRVVRAEPDLSAVPPTLRRVIEACLTKDPAERVQLPALASMISASGPATVATLGAFWPAPLDGIIAASQSYPTPTRVGPAADAAAAGAGSAFGLSGQAPFASAGSFGSAGSSGAEAPVSPAPSVVAQGSQPPSGYLPTATALGGPSQPGSGLPASGSPVSGSPGSGLPGSGSSAGGARGQSSATPGFAGDAGMMADGYLQAATRSMISGNPLSPPYSGQPVTPQGFQSPVTQQPGTDNPATKRGPWAQPGGAGQPATPWGQQPGAAGSGSGAQYGAGGSAGYGGSGAQYGAAGSGYGGSGSQYGAAGPGYGDSGSQYGAGAGYGGSGAQYGASGGSGSTPWPQQATPTPWTQGGADPLAQYTPGMRRPATGEVPGPVLNAVRLMWVGLAASIVELVIALATLASYAKLLKDSKNNVGRYFTGTLPYDTATNIINHEPTWSAVVVTFGVVASIIALICWTWLAVACRGGRGWTRVAGTVLFGINSIGTVYLLVGSWDDFALKAVACVVWGIGLAAMILLWSSQAGAFFTTWRTSAPRRV